MKKKGRIDFMQDRNITNKTNTSKKGNNNMKYNEYMILQAKKRYAAGVPFEKVIEETLKQAFEDYRFLICYNLTKEIIELEKKEKGRGRNERQ